MFYAKKGVSYWYEIHGAGPTIVLLHGFTGTSSTWLRFVESWQTDFQIVTIDLPGHGKTKIKKPRTMEACCKDLIDLFNHLNLKDIHLLGYSLGGRTALSFAIMYPEVIKTLLLESASPGLELAEDREKRVRHDEKLAQKIELEGVPKFVDFWENIQLFETQKQLPVNQRQVIREERLSQSEEGLAVSLRYMGTGAQPNWWDTLERFTKPVLLIAGELDDKFVQINKSMHNRLQASRLTVVKNAGHAIHVEQADFFGKLVIEYINAAT